MPLQACPFWRRERQKLARDVALSLGGMIVRKEVCDQLISECEQTCQKLGGDLYEVMKKAPQVVEKWKRYAPFFQQVWNNAKNREELAAFLLTAGPDPRPEELETVLTFNKDGSISFAESSPGCGKKSATFPWRSPTGVESPAKQGNLHANRATIRTGSRVARCAEAYGKALPRKPANHTKSVATKSQVEIRCYIKDKRDVHSGIRMVFRFCLR